MATSIGRSTSCGSGGRIAAGWPLGSTTCSVDGRPANGLPSGTPQQGYATSPGTLTTGSKPISATTDSGWTTTAAAAERNTSRPQPPVACPSRHPHMPPGSGRRSCRWSTGSRCVDASQVRQFAVAAIERTAADRSTAWAATTTGRVFISKNVDAEPASAVSWTRLDDDAVTPNRFVSSIYVDPTDGNHAWISYSGYNSNTPATPGHVFEVTFNPVSGKSSWVDRSYDFGDLPVTDLVRDGVTGDLYASCDFGVLRLAAGTTTWTSAAPGMPNVEVAGLTILPQDRILYAASHGLSAWRLNLNP